MNKLSPASGPGETRPRTGLRPTRPQQAAGIRVEPPPSLPWAIGTMPAATAAPEPPLEPPGVRFSVPGIAGRAEAARLGRREDPQLRQGRLADDHEPGLTQAAYEERVAGGQ